MAILAIAWDNSAHRLRVQTGGYGSSLIAPQSIISSLIAPFAVGDGHLASGLDANKLNIGLLPQARISGLPYANLALSGRLANTDILSGITATKLLSGYPGERVGSGYPAGGLTGQIPQARISGLFVSGLMLSGGIQPDDIRFLAGMISRPTPVGCVLDLDFNEGAGGMAYDKSGENNDGTIEGATWADGLFGKCLSFDGDNDYVDCGKSASLQLGTGNLTLEAWIKTNGDQSAQMMTIIGKAPYGDDPNSGLAFDNPNTGYLRFGIRFSGGSDEWTTSFRPFDGIWHHIVAVRSGNDAIVYMDGLSQINANYFIHGNDASAPGFSLEIGRAPATAYFNGLIDEVRIYNRALSADEISGRYIQGLAKLGKLEGSLRLFTSGLLSGAAWQPRIHLDPYSADFQALSGAVRTSGRFYAGSQQVQMTTPAGYMTSAFISGGLVDGRIASGIAAQKLLSGYHGYKVASGYPALGLTGLVPEARISGYFSSGMHNFEHPDSLILSGITATKLLSGYPGERVASGYPAVGLTGFWATSGLINKALISGYFTSGMHNFEHPLALIPTILSGTIGSGQVGTDHLGYRAVLSGNIGSGQIGGAHLGYLGNLFLAAQGIVSGQADPSYGVRPRGIQIRSGEAAFCVGVTPNDFASSKDASWFFINPTGVPISAYLTTEITYGRPTSALAIALFDDLFSLDGGRWRSLTIDPLGLNNLAGGMPVAVKVYGQKAPTTSGLHVVGMNIVYYRK